MQSAHPRVFIAVVLLLTMVGACVESIPDTDDDDDSFGQHSGIPDDHEQSESELGTVYPDDQFYASVRAFPSAEGFGANSRGARSSDARIMFITNRNDDGPGSARAAFEASGPRYIIPLVWGYVDVIDDGYTIRNDKLTYAGQFMPDGHGLVFRNRDPDGGGAIIYARGASDLIFRYLKIYYGYARGSDDTCCGNAVTLYRDGDGDYGENIIFDRFAIAFTTDNVLGSRGSDVTWQHGFVLYPLHHANHEKGSHGKGPLIGYDSRDVTYHHNYQTLSNDRHPMLSSEGGTIDLRNNYNYNTVWGPTFRNDDSGSAANYNYVGNLIDAGSLTRDKNKWYWALVKMKASGPEYPQIYLEGNENPRIDADGDQWKDVYFKPGDGGVTTPDDADVYRVDAPHPAPPVRETDVFTAKDEILTYGGPSFVVDPLTGELRDVRDELLERAVREAREDSGPGESINGHGYRQPFTDLEPDIDHGGISEQEFWNEHFDPWRDEHYPGVEWNDFVDSNGDGSLDYQLIEVYLNSWVPDFPSLE